MVSMAQVQNGVAKYIDAEIVGKLTDWRKWVIGAGAALMIQDLPATLSRYKENEIVKMLGVIDSDNNVDIDKLYKQFQAQAQKGAITFTAPVLGAVTLNASDVDKLYHFVVNG